MQSNAWKGSNAAEGGYKPAVHEERKENIMNLNKEKFLKTELGSELKSCITAWDMALDVCRRFKYYTEEYKRNRKAADRCQAQWEVYQMAIKQFYGVEYHFTRTEEYFGLVTEDEENWLFKVEKENSNGGKSDE